MSDINSAIQAITQEGTSSEEIVSKIITKALDDELEPALSSICDTRNDAQITLAILESLSALKCPEALKPTLKKTGFVELNGELLFTKYHHLTLQQMMDIKQSTSLFT